MTDGDVERMVDNGGVGDGRGGAENVFFSGGPSPTASGPGEVWGSVRRCFVFEQRPLIFFFNIYLFYFIFR
jgi:hypothetical protein